MGDYFCDFEKVYFLGEWVLYKISYYSHKYSFMISWMTGMYLLDTNHDTFC